MSKKAKIDILQTGYGHTDENGVYHASATCTLVTLDQLVVIVDPGGAWQRSDIESKLSERNLRVDDIDVVVGTHGHSDHIGNLNLFPGAKHLVGFDVNVGDTYEDHDFKAGTPYILLQDRLVILPTPGHMHHDISLVVYGADDLGTVGICGDLFETEEDEGVWQEISECVEIQEKNRKKMLQLCDYIVPGHGPMFKNNLKENIIEK